VLASSNSNALVSLPAGTADVFAFLDPASRAVVTGTGTMGLALADIGNLLLWSGRGAASVFLPAVAIVPQGNGFLVVNGGTAALSWRGRSGRCRLPAHAAPRWVFKPKNVQPFQRVPVMARAMADSDRYGRPSHS